MKTIIYMWEADHRKIKILGITKILSRHPRSPQGLKGV
jgi:hypothetical protein